MLCPKCRKEMEAGQLRSAKNIYFTTAPLDYFVVAQDGIKITQSLWTTPHVSAWHCKDCKLVIADYNEED